METDNILTAPQVMPVGALYEKWDQRDMSTLKDFYRFLTTPSPERSRFLDSHPSAVDFIGPLATTTVTT